MNIAVIFAGGAGKRMRTKDKPKQFLEIYNKPIIIYTLEHFENNPDIDAIVIACIEDWIPHLKKLVSKYGISKVKKIVPGGASGQLSIYNGLCAARDYIAESGTECNNSSEKENENLSDGVSPKLSNERDIVLIHDGVRPLINEKLLSENIECVEKNGSAITAGIVKETIVVVDEENHIKHVPSRANSRVAKAPQSFYLDDILSAHEKALSEGITDFIDSCTMMQHYGYNLTMVDGPYENIKITTPDDFYTMRAILEAKENAQIYGFDE